MGFPMRAVNYEEPDGGGLSERTCRLLAGADTGVAGGILVLAWLVFAARMQGGFWWTHWNVAGSILYGERVYGMGFGVASAAGASVLLLLYAGLGMLFSFLARARGLGFNLLAGLTVALLWHQAAAFIFWPRWGPGVMFYLHPAVMLPANVLFGAALVRFGPRFRRVAVTLGDAAWAWQYHPPPEAPAIPPPSPVAAPEEDSAPPVENRPEPDRPPDC
jgi:hypothetical protein